MRKSERTYKSFESDLRKEEWQEEDQEHEDEVRETIVKWFTEMK